MRMTQKESSTWLRRSIHSSEDMPSPFAILIEKGHFPDPTAGMGIHPRFHDDYAQYLHLVDPSFKLFSESRYVLRPLIRSPKRLALVRFCNGFIEIDPFVVLSFISMQVET
jgi:hypothetical protein